MVADDLKGIRDYIAEDNAAFADETMNDIYGKFEQIQMCPGMESELSKRVSFHSDYKYVVGKTM